MTNHLRKARAVAIAAMVMGVSTLVFTQAGQQNTPPVRNYNAAPKAGKKYVATKEIIFDKKMEPS